MEENILEINENIEVSSTFKKIQSKNLWDNVREIDKKNGETCNNLGKDFENNRNNGYNIDNVSLDSEEGFYFEDEDLNTFDDKGIQECMEKSLKSKDCNSEHSLEKDKVKYNGLSLTDDKVVKKEDYLLGVGENPSYCNNKNNGYFAREESKDTLQQSKSNFDIGNIYDSDYNGETIISNASVDNKKNLAKEELKIHEHTNDNKNFYELNMDEMPNRKNLLEELYKDELMESTEQNRMQKQKTKEIKILGKIFKRSEK